MNETNFTPGIPNSVDTKTEEVIEEKIDWVEKAIEREATPKQLRKETLEEFSKKYGIDPSTYQARSVELRSRKSYCYVMAPAITTQSLLWSRRMTAELFLDVDRNKLPERHEHDEYITERNLIHAAIDFLGPTRGSRILDIGAGDGRWGLITADKLMAQELVGGEIRKIDKPLGFTEWHQNRDFLTFETDRPFEMIVSNPPYYCAEEIIRRAWTMLAPVGHMVMLLRQAFQTGVDRYNNLWSQLHPHTVTVCSRRPSFYGGGTNRTEFSVLFTGARTGTDTHSALPADGTPIYSYMKGMKKAPRGARIAPAGPGAPGGPLRRATRGAGARAAPVAGRTRGHRPRRAHAEGGAGRPLPTEETP